MPFYEDYGAGRSRTPQEALLAALIAARQGVQGAVNPIQQMFEGMNFGPVNQGVMYSPGQSVFYPPEATPGIYPQSENAGGGPEPGVDYTPGSSNYASWDPEAIGTTNSYEARNPDLLGGSYANALATSPYGPEGGGGPEMPEYEMYDLTQDPLWRRLVNQASNVPTVDYDKLIKENAAAIRGAYGPQIGGIRGDIRDTNQEFRENQGIIRGIGNQMGGRLERQAGRAQRQSEQRVQNIEDTATRRAAGVERGGNREARQTMELLKSIGQEESGATVLQDIQQEEQGAKQDIQQEAKVRANVEDRQGQAEEDYLRSMAAGARLFGAEGVADLIDQRTDIVRGLRNEIAQLKGARGAEIANMTTGLNQAEAEQNVAAQSQVYDRLFSLLGFKEDVRSEEQARLDQLQQYALDYGLSQDQLALQQQQMLLDQTYGGTEEVPSLLDNLSTSQANYYNYVAQAFPGDTTKQDEAAAALNSVLPLIGTVHTEDREYGEEEVENSPYYITSKLIETLMSQYGWSQSEAQAMTQPAMQYFWGAG